MIETKVDKYLSESVGIWLHKNSKLAKVLGYVDTGAKCCGTCFHYENGCANQEVDEILTKLKGSQTYIAVRTTDKCKYWESLDEE